MTWKVVLIDEKNEPIEFADNELDLQWQGDQGFSDKPLKLLRYLDPYGNTYFNALQVDDVIKDLNTFKSDSTDANVINQVVELALRCKSEPHTYLAFYGD